MPRPLPRPLPLLPRRRALAAAGAACVVLLTAVPATAAPATAVPGRAAGPGSLVLVGGGLRADNDEVYGEIIRRAGGSGARIGVLTAASVPASRDPHAGDPDRCSNSECNGAYYADLFKRHGAEHAEWIPIDLDHIANADDDEVVARIDSMTGFFFGGGDQYRYVTTLLNGGDHTDSRALAAIRRKLARGAVVAGSSAGAQITAGRDMVTGGESYRGLRDGSTPGYFDDATRLGHLPDGGFGFLRSGLIDTHTGAYGREGRAVRLAADTGHHRVYALEENTALIVDRPGTDREAMTVAGPNGVAVLDLRAARTATSARGWSIDGVRYSYLTDGDRYDAHSWRPEPGPGKRPYTPSGTTPVAANGDVFYSAANPDGVPYSFRSTARALAATRAQRTAAATTFETAPRFLVVLGKRPPFRAWSTDGSAPQSLLNLSVAIRPQ
ncbi:cyanophycinase [Streptomyces sp. PKU-MA01144]|uniref:cyanophycinase n=1 Tax=Streptomyces sp. PKU-MA01144 TaxID=2729138 RepID=UPI002811CD02|nr:cyanophycinase [Streptomyces sp. PKU-MA01144]